MQAITALPQPVSPRCMAWRRRRAAELIATCDPRVASEQARFATPGVDIGLFCSYPRRAAGAQRAPPPPPGRKAAMEMLLLAR